jgi:hypothetical protein
VGHPIRYPHHLEKRITQSEGRWVRYKS